MRIASLCSPLGAGSSKSSGTVNGDVPAAWPRRVTFMPCRRTGPTPGTGSFKAPGAHSSAGGVKEPLQVVFPRGHSDVDKVRRVARGIIGQRLQYVGPAGWFPVVMFGFVVSAGR